MVERRRVLHGRRPVGVQRDLVDVARVERAEEQVAFTGGAEVAPVAEGDPGRTDRRRVEQLRRDRLRAVAVRVLGRLTLAVLRRAPAVVAARDDPVELIVALGPVLRLPQVACLRIEREPEAVAMPVGVDPRPREGVVARDAARRRHPEHLAAVHRLVLRELGLLGLPDDHVEHAVGTEEHPSAVVADPRLLHVQEQLHRLPAIAIHLDAQDLVLRDAVDLPGGVGVQPRLLRERRREREPHQPLLVRHVADHAGDREDRGVLARLRVDPADLAGQPLPVVDRAGAVQDEGGRMVEVRRDGLLDDRAAGRLRCGGRTGRARRGRRGRRGGGLAGRRRRRAADEQDRCDPDQEATGGHIRRILAGGRQKPVSPRPTPSTKPCSGGDRCPSR